MKHFNLIGLLLIFFLPFVQLNSSELARKNGNENTVSHNEAIKNTENAVLANAVSMMLSCPLTNPYPGFPIDFLNDNTGWIDYDLGGDLSLTHNPNGTKTITGSIINGTPIDFGSGSNGTACGADDSWSLNLTLSDKKTWSEWQSMGGDANINGSCATSLREDLEYWLVTGTLTGAGCRAGESISINGSNNNFRFQLGTAGNFGSSDCTLFGLSTWFDSTWDDGTNPPTPVQSDMYAFVDETCYSNPPSGVAGFCQSNSTTQITGAVFQDYNCDGMYDNSDNLGIEGMPVSATDSLGNSFNAVTDASGNYTIAGLTNNRTYRVEFTFPDSLLWAKPTLYGDDNGTTVQFLKPGNCANLGVASPADFCQDNPYVGTACYINGTGNTTGYNGYFSFDY